MERRYTLALCLALAQRGAEHWSYADLARSLGLSASEAHAAVSRARLAGLMRGRDVDRRALLEFVEHGVRYALYAERTAPTRGVPTGVKAPPLASLMASEDGPVWASAHGGARGNGLKPLYRSLPDAALQDPTLHETLALVDAVRDGGVRERTLAMEELRRRLSHPAAGNPDG